MALILGIETSCDETAAAVVKDGYEVLSSSVASQIAKHAAHGGVVPELAAREHLTALTPVLDGALREAGVTLAEIDAIAVTQGPGLIPALLVGLSFAKGLAMGNRIPYVGVNHFIGHIYGAFLDEANRALEDGASYPFRADIPRSSSSGGTERRPRSAARSTTRRARRSTRARSCSISAIRAARSCSGRPRAEIRTGSNSRAR